MPYRNTERLPSGIFPNPRIDLSPTGYRKECQIDHCGKTVSEDIGIPLCDAHLRKAWAAFEVRIETDPSLMPDRRTPRPKDVTSVDAHGMVYFARVGELIKIGWSTDVEHRMYALGADALLHAQPGTKHDEKALHAMFNHLLVKGREWFRPDPELLNYISGLH